MNTITHQQMQQFAKAELADLSRDMLTWRKTGALPEGRFQELVTLAGPIAQHDAFQRAEAAVITAALEFAEGKSAEAVPVSPRATQLSPSSWQERLRGWLREHHPEVQDWPDVIIARDVDLVRDSSETARSIEAHVIEGHPFFAEELQGFLQRVKAPPGHVLVVLEDPNAAEDAEPAHIGVVLPSYVIG
ncbi:MULTISPECIES: hypothetical protein [Achromobacter]|uniref:hypothetical protein n=1 Tax=Achromobacter TaxID=222 RepID=UPI0023F6AAE1|nr:hypothetical protein [Achromobacter anxifer]MDF8363367.1 hypothetical protein [Achromobacter anxifer]